MWSMRVAHSEIEKLSNISSKKDILSQHFRTKLMRLLYKPYQLILIRDLLVVVMDSTSLDDLSRHTKSAGK